MHRYPLFTTVVVQVHYLLLLPSLQLDLAKEKESLKSVQLEFIILIPFISHS